MLSAVPCGGTVTGGVSRAVSAVMDEPPRGRPRRCGPGPALLYQKWVGLRAAAGIDSAMLPRPAGALIGAVALGFLGALGAPAPAPAQENFEIQVYGSETVDSRTPLAELHRNVAP